MLFTLLLVRSLEGLCAGACSCLPMKTLMIKDHRCNVYTDKVIAIYPIVPTHGPASEEIYIQNIRSGESGEPLCKNEKTGTKIHLPERKFSCACDNRIVLYDTISAPGIGSFVVFDTISGSKKF